MKTEATERTPEVLDLPELQEASENQDQLIAEVVWLEMIVDLELQDDQLQSTTRETQDVRHTIEDPDL